MSAITALAVIATVLRVVLGALVLITGIWAYRRFRLPSVPWLAAYLLLGILLALPMSHIAKHVLDHGLAAGATRDLFGFTVGEFLVAMSYLSSIFATLAQALIAWFVAAEFAHAYVGSTSIGALPVFLSIPRRHSYAVGLALLGCVVVVPILWLALAARA
jgi:hypothetical protein